jgi:hypothetical protein
MAEVAGELLAAIASEFPMRPEGGIHHGKFSYWLEQQNMAPVRLFGIPRSNLLQLMHLIY